MLSAVKLISSFVGKGFSSKAEESADVSKKKKHVLNTIVVL